VQNPVGPNPLILKPGRLDIQKEKLMLTSRIVAPIVLVVALCGSLALAGPITFDGTVDPNEPYVAFLNDDNGEAGLGTSSFDIDRVGFDQDADWFYIGLDTVGMYDPNGNVGAYPESTFVNIVLDDGSSTLMFNFASSDSGDMMYANGGTPLAAGWESEYDQDLELRFDNSLFAGFNVQNMFVRMSLEDFDWSQTVDVDDVVTGQVIGVPEPATLSLLGLGAGAMLIRRRRRK
jgi:hypothetical protein